MKARNLLQILAPLCLGFLSFAASGQSDLTVTGLARIGDASQPGLSGSRAVSEVSANGGPSGMVTVHAAQRGTPYISLCDGHPLSGNSAQIGHTQPLALAAADFDGDGVPDLVSGYGAGTSGKITVRRGNVNALWPYGAALRNGPPPAFLPGERTFAIPEKPDFIGTGDFDADGHWDVVTGQVGSSALYFLRGDGHGGFGEAQRIPLPGTVTALITGEINRVDGLTDLIVAVKSENGPRVLVFESPMGALKVEPEVFVLAHPATALALGRLDGTAMSDLAVAAGNQIIVIHGRDRKLSLSAEQRASVAPAKVTVQEFPYEVLALVTGDFTGTGPSVAALDGDGSVHILNHALAPNALGAATLRDPAFEPTFKPAKNGVDGKSMAFGGTMTPGKAASLAAFRQAMKTAAESPEWIERSEVTLPAGFAQVSPRLVAARVTGSLQEDIVAVDSGTSRVHVLSTVPTTGKARSTAVVRGSAPSPAQMRLLGSLEASSAPAVALPMRLSRHGLNGLVILQAGQAEPTIMPQDTPPANTFTVTNTSDAIIAVGPEVTGPAGSLRKALYDASQATGTSSIVFNIPTSDPGYNSTTGTFLIQPLSEAEPGALNDFALNPINATVIIDGYTQLGASPNTLANGDNAKLLIQIDGSKATTPGGSGLVPFDDVGSVYRGLVFTGWTTPDITTGPSGSTASGAEGMEANGVQDFIEGNFFGTDPTGKVAAPNRIGIFADNGPGLGSTSGGNIIGGTTPQARNILSGNNNSGVLFLATSFEAQLQGNFIGLDVTGAAIVSNPQEADRSNSFDGVGLNGATITIGGTLPGTANVIAGNGTNVDINDLTNGNQATDSLVQGNLIGTDVTGTVGILSQGYGVSILNNPTDMLIGGTTPAARNVISGNLAGVYIFDNSFDNIVQGNYIGVDITGTKALGNVNQGFITGSTGSAVLPPAGDTTIGGTVAGAGNVISGNLLDGIQIAGTSLGPNGQDQVNQGNFVLGNFIGTDATGTVSIPNGGNGVDLISSATNNIIGGSAPGSGNLIANNALNGVLIDPGTTAGTGTGNNTVANIIQANTGAGVRINTGNSNRISQNAIFANGDLGINLQNAGPNLNTNCNSTNTGANNLQNAPSLTGGSGTAFITATATDPNGNTSEFSNAVLSSLSGNVLDLLGNFNSTPSTTYTIEFFSSTSADPSGYGEGQTYLTSTSVTTGTDCTVPINNPVDSTQADLDVKLTSDTTVFSVGPDFGGYQFTGTVTNNGPATAHNVVFTDTLPAGLAISSAYCDVGPCQSPAVSSLGNCTVSGNTITCNMGTMAPGATAQATIPVQATGAGSLADSAGVTATEADPNLANNTARLNEAVYYSFPFIDHLDPVSALTQTSGGLAINVYGNGFLPTSAVTFNGTAVATTAYLDNQVCGGPFQPGFCSAIQVSVPASLLGVAGTPTVTVTNPDPGPGGGPNQPATATFTLVTACTYSAQDFGFNPVESSGDTLIPESIEVTTNAPTCPWTAVSNDPWLVVLDNASSAGSGSLDVSVAPNTGAARTGTVTVAGQAVEIDQAAGDSTVCDYGLNPGSAIIPAAGATGTFAVTTGSQCSYYVEPYPQNSTYVTGVQFITIPQTSSLLVGPGNPSYTVAANHGAPRLGAIMVGGEVFTLTQNAPSCYYTLSTTSATVPVGGATGTIEVTASASNCAWTAVSSNTSLLSVTSGASGTGNGTVSYSVPVNAEGPQTTTITIGDANGYAVFTENQNSAFTCTFIISPASVEVPSNGVSNFFGITASYNFCKWTALSSDPSSLTVGDVSGAAGLSTTGSAVGSGAVYYRVAQNSTGTPRTITITAGCETFTVNQDGALISNPVPAISTLSPTSTTAGSGGFNLTVNGSGFVNGSQVNFGGIARAATYVSANQVTAAILASDVAAVGTPAVNVTNPTPGGGTSNSVTFNVTAATAPAATLTATLPFPSTTVNITSSPLVATLSNTGNATLNISGIAIGGTNPTDFAITTGTNACGATLAANATCSIYVTFTPAAAQAYAATLTVTDNATPTTRSASLTGTGTVVAAPVATLTAALPFPSTTVNTTSSPLVATLSNTGNATLNIGGIAIGGTNPTDFAITTGTNACGATLAANTTCSIYVTLTPAAAQTYAATLTVTDNATPTTQSASLTGTGTAVAAPVATLTATLPFPSTTVNATSSPSVATLSNTGNATLNISSIAIGGTNPADFAITTGTNACGATLAANSTCSIYVTFTPAAAQAYSATLTVTDNAAPTTQTASLTGAGTAPAAPIATLTPASLSFTATTGTTSAVQLATLSNTGNATLNISSITIGGTNPADFAITTGTNSCSESLAASASCSIYVTFTPTSAANFPASLQVTDNASGSPQSTSLSGTGTAPVVASFTISSSTSAQTVQPGGTASYTISATAQNGAFTNPVALTTNGLPAGATATFTPASITPGSSSATSTLSIQTATTTVAVTRRSKGWPLAAPALAIVSLFFLPGKRRRRWITMALLLFASLGAITALSGCGGGFSLTPPAQTYTVTVNGTSGAIQQSTTVQLTVQ